ncbi:MAG: outer membrane protein transport protein [Bacteroidetes bacterium]|nr:outer membrane protein transport protein [Bacteroidota bacterium]
MRKTIFILLAYILFTNKTSAQQPEDALKYSNLGFGSTARSASLAGAIGAVGNDFASIAYNPAGLAVNRHHVFNITLGNNSVNTNSSYINQTDNNSLRKLTLPSFGLILTSVQYDKKKPVTDGWCNFNFGIGYNQISNYNSNFFYQGNNRKSSISNAFAQLGNKYRDDPNFILTDGGSPENLALQTGLINNYPIYDSAQKTFINNYEATYTKQNYATGKGPVFTQNGSGYYSGRTNEFDLGFAANHSNKLFIGASLSIGAIKYQKILTHEEADSGNRINEFKTLKYTETVKTTGASVGIKIGAIYRVTDAFRLGFAIHSPQVFNLHDQYSYKLSVLKDGNTNLIEAQTEDPGFYYDYKFKLPTRFILSWAYVKDKAGLFSMDLEIPNYKKASFNDSNNALKDRNNYILNNFSTGIVFRTGGEIYIDQFFLRAGVALYSSPFDNKEFYKEANQSKQVFAAGIGYHAKKYSIDFAYTFTTSKYYYSPYTLSNTTDYYSSINQTKNNQLILTYITRF